MAVNTTLARLHGSSRYGVEWWQCLLGDGATNTATTQTLTAVPAWGAVIAVAHFRNAGYTDGTFTMRIQGSNDNSNYSNIGAAAAAVSSANQEVSTGVAEGSSITTGVIGYGANLPRWLRVVVTVTGTPATGSVLSFVYLKLVFAGDQTAVI